ASFIFYLLYKLEYVKAKDTQILKITDPENLNHEDMIKNIFQNLTESVKLRQVETTNLGTMILYTYANGNKPTTNDKELIDQIREKNANLKVSLTYVHGEE